MTTSLPEICQQLIRAYARLDFGHGRTVAAPYYKNNPKQRRFTTPVEGGKGTPNEIILETKIRAREQGINFDPLIPALIREFMMREGIGIDCSGFAARVMDCLVRATTGQSFTQAIKPMGYGWRKIVYHFRPFQNTNVLTLTSPVNSNPAALPTLQPGDLIRTRGGNHVLLVTDVVRDTGGCIQDFRYAHSSGQFGEESGVRTGEVTITNPQEDLAHQEWKEVWNGTIPSREGWEENHEKNGIFRLRVLKEGES